jgi:hypothetical protein
MNVFIMNPIKVLKCCTYVVPKQKKPLKNEGLLTAKLQSLSTGGETRTLTPCGTRS